MSNINRDRNYEWPVPRTLLRIWIGLLGLGSMTSILLLVKNRYDWLDAVDAIRTWPLDPICLIVIALYLICIPMLKQQWRLIMASFLTAYSLWFFVMSLPSWVKVLRLDEKIHYGILVENLIMVILCLILLFLALRNYKSRLVIVALIFCNVLSISSTMDSVGHLTSYYDTHYNGG
jgi:hypothetical protein